MRILYINTTDITGGAAIACERLNRAMRSQQGCATLTLAHRKNSSLSYVAQILPTPKPGARRSLRHHLSYWINDVLGFQYRCLPAESAAILKKARAFKPDIIHLHNTHAGKTGFFESSLFAKLSSIAPVVWTLHDMWGLTGHCAYSYGCERWRTGCGQCPDLKLYPAINHDRTAYLWKWKQSIYRRSRLTLVAPSRWLTNLAAESSIFAVTPAHHIFNGIDLDIFKPGGEPELREKHGIPSDAVVLMFVAEKLENNNRKGGPQLLKLLHWLSTHTTQPLHVFAVGDGKFTLPAELSNVRVHLTGYLNHDRQLARYYRASDLFVFPSLQDNLPNTLVEAQACGLPCAVFDVGGCAEAVESGVTGVLSPAPDAEDLARKILGLIQDREKLRTFSLQARQRAEERFNISTMAENHMKLYRDLAKERP